MSLRSDPVKCANTLKNNTKQLFFGKIWWKVIQSLSLLRQQYIIQWSKNDNKLYNVIYTMHGTKNIWLVTKISKLQSLILFVLTFPFSRSQNLRLWSKEPLITFLLSNVKFKHVTASWWPVSVIRHEPSAKLHTYQTNMHTCLIFLNHVCHVAFESLRLFESG